MAPRPPRFSFAQADPHTLCIDIGGSHIKAAVVDWHGALASEHLSVDTPPWDQLTPPVLVDALVALVEPLEGYGRVSVGVPGVVHRGVVYSVPVTRDVTYRGFDLAARLGERLARPVRVLNDAAIQGLGAIEGAGVEMVITLGTGLGAALFIDGELGPRMQFVSRPERKDPTGGPYGELMRRRLGVTRWSARVGDLIELLRQLTNFERLYIGGGNAPRLSLDLPKDVTVVENMAGVIGGVRLWQYEATT